MSNIAPLDNRRSIMETMAQKFGMERSAFESTLMQTIIKDGTKEQTAAFLVVAHQYNLNPFTKEIFAFPAKGGGIQPVVSVDGWMKLINSHPDFDGMDFRDTLNDKGELVSVTCRMHRKGRSHPTEVTEYMSECRRDVDTWRKWPARMLRHKAAIQAARYAFGFSGIVEPDEAERAQEVTVESVPLAQIADDRKRRCDEAAEQYAASVEKIKEAIEKDDAYTVRECWDEIPSAARMDLWLAPSKGGVFTTAERSYIKCLPASDATETPKTEEQL